MYYIFALIYNDNLFIVSIICLDKLFKLCTCLYFHKRNKLKLVGFL